MAVTSLSQLFEQQARAYITPLNEDTGKEQDGEVFAFQYFPESINDNKGVNYSDHDIPGGSHPLKQWVSGGARTISFEAIFTQELRPQTTTGVSISISTITTSHDSKYSVDVRGAIARLRSLIYPTYKGGFARPPERILLTVPGLGLGHGFTGGSLQDSMMCIVTEVGVEYQHLFPDGTPRYVTVSLEFEEIVQRPGGASGGIRFVDRVGFKKVRDRYKVKPTIKGNSPGRRRTD